MPPLYVYTAKIMYCHCMPTDVYLSFDEEILYVEEDVGVVDICLVLSNVTGVTKDPLPIDVFSVYSSAMRTSQ